MKTHREISDAINQVQLLPDEDTNGQIADILHDLNDRIENLAHGVKTAHDSIQDLDDKIANV